MSRFRVGDVVVYVMTMHRTELLGQEATVLAIGQSFRWNDEVRHDGILTSLSIPGPGPIGTRAAPEQLRLRRPPSWDRWIYDTSDVDQPVAHNEERKIVSPLKGEVGA